MSSESGLDFDTDLAGNRIAEAITHRLNQAIPSGRAADVARRSGVSYNSLQKYLDGRQPRPAVLVALAKATGVRIEWLLTGEGLMREGEAAPVPPAPDAPPGPPAAPPRAQDVLDLDDLVVAYEVVLGAFAARGVTRPEPRKVLALTLAIYDAGQQAMREEVDVAAASASD